LEVTHRGRHRAAGGDRGMISLSMSGAAAGEFRVLCLGCHSDDLEIGCGGTILRLANERPDCVFHWVVFSAIGARAEEARQAVTRLIDPSRLASLTLAEFPDGFMPFKGAEIKSTFEGIKRTVSPDLILTHNRKDAHQDHRLIAELTWNTFRDHLILEYEIPKYDGDMGRPGVFVPLPLELCEHKIQLLMDSFLSQRGKSWFRPDTFFSLMRLRGMECNAPSGYAEAFYCRKLLL
jgi:LmbE family N-acetylglucosaminyl deacetylase